MISYPRPQFYVINERYPPTSLNTLFCPARVYWGGRLIDFSFLFVKSELSGRFLGFHSYSKHSDRLGSLEVLSRLSEDYFRYLFDK